MTPKQLVALLLVMKAEAEEVRKARAEVTVAMHASNVRMQSACEKLEAAVALRKEISADLKASAAIAVMMRRGWHATRNVDQWLCVIPGVDRAGQGGGFVADDPSSALIEAEKWYVANVEAKP